MPIHSTPRFLPETEDFQKLHIWLIGGTDDSYDIQVDNGELYEFGSSSDEEEQGVQFWAQGGQFNVEIEPARWVEVCDSLSC